MGGKGIPAFWTQCGVGTFLEEGGFVQKLVRQESGGCGVELSEPKESRIFSGKKYLLEEAINGEISIIKAQKADLAGNLVYNQSARNFN